MPSRTGLHGQTRNSITQLTVLERELSKVRQFHYAHDNEELELGVRCMAAGIYDDQGKLVAGLSISAPASRLDEAWLAPLTGHCGTDLCRRLVSYRAAVYPER